MSDDSKPGPSTFTCALVGLGAAAGVCGVMALLARDSEKGGFGAIASRTPRAVSIAKLPKRVREFYKNDIIYDIRPEYPGSKSFIVETIYLASGRGPLTTGKITWTGGSAVENGAWAVPPSELAAAKQFFRVHASPEDVEKLRKWEEEREQEWLVERAAEDALVARRRAWEKSQLALYTLEWIDASGKRRTG